MRGEPPSIVSVDPPKPVLANDSRPESPCTKVCALDTQGFCLGCLRTGDEIARWRSMSALEQWQLIAALDERRNARQR
jgi:predicted Fe-S protein YdhL (DUF1289 family)